MGHLLYLDVRHLIGLIILTKHVDRASFREVKPISNRSGLLEIGDRKARGKTIRILTAAKKMAVKEKSEKEEMVEWSAEEEIQLFLALEGLRPVGINKHFYMLCICDRLSKALKRDISADTVWAHLRTLYNLDVLDQQQRIPSIVEELTEFSLPDDDYGELMARKLSETIVEREEVNKTKEKETSKPDVVKTKQTVPIPNTNQTVPIPNPIPIVSTAGQSTTTTTKHTTVHSSASQSKDNERKGTSSATTKTQNDSVPKRIPKRTRNSLSLESSSSPSTTPPPIQMKRRRI